MALVKPVIFQVAGYQNSGKTTFVLQLIALLKTDGLKVVTIKHHGHGGIPSVDEDKDSSRHLESGAAAAIVEGEGRLLLQSERKAWTLEEKISLLRFFEPDIILIEGFKKEKYPKVVMIRNKQDEELLTNLCNVKAIIFWEEDQSRLAGKLGTPCFQISDPESLKWVTDYLKNQLNEENS